MARVISKLGLASRAQAAQWVLAGRVRVDGQRVWDAEFPVRSGAQRVTIDGREPQAAARLVLMLNKPRGLITTRQDEQGRRTVYECFAGAELPWVAPVGRLDQASEGLLLFSNDPAWAARMTDPHTSPPKTYHVQIDRLADASLLRALLAGAQADGESLKVASARVLRSGVRHAWLELTLREGRNRHIRRLLAALDVAVLRLVRVAVGPVVLGKLPKGKWRALAAEEIAAL